MDKGKEMVEKHFQQVFPWYKSGYHAINLLFFILYLILTVRLMNFTSQQEMKTVMEKYFEKKLFKDPLSSISRQQITMND